MRKSDIPFDSDDSHAFLPWIIGIMAGLATLLLCLGVTVGGWMIDRGDNYSHSFTVSIPSTTENLSEKQEQIRDLLQKLSGVTGVEQMREEKLREMLKPWLGNAEAISALPLPVMLDVTLAPNAAIDYKALQTKLSSMAEGTEVDAHERWIENFSRFSAAIRSLMAMLAILIIGGLALMVALMSRASLKLHKKTVGILHAIGAEDRYITRQFQHEAWLLTLRGTIPGCALAGFAYWGAGFYVASLQSSLLPPLAMGYAHALVLVLMPIACGALAWMAARLSVIKQLRQVL